MAEPFAQFGARRDLFEPKVNPGSPFRYASRPEPIDQHPETVVFFSRLVRSFEFDHPAIPYGGSLIIPGALRLLLIPNCAAANAHWPANSAICLSAHSALYGVRDHGLVNSFELIFMTLRRGEISSNDIISILSQ